MAHFLLINSEAVPSKATDCNMSLPYFFFCYAQRYEKQHYANFAFELLQENLSQMLNNIQSREDSCLDALEMGWGLMQFVENDFFDSDELDEILLPFDTISIQETERLSRGTVSSDNVHELLLVACYFLARIGHLDIRAEHYPSIREHLLISFFELVHQMDGWDKEDITWIILMGLLLEKSKEYGETSHLAIKGIQKLKSHILLDNEKVVEIYTLAMTKGNLNDALLLSLCFSGKIKSITDSNDILRKIMEDRIANGSKQLYKLGGDTPSTNVQSIIIYALALFEWPVAKNSSFLIHTVAKLINEK